MLLTDCHILTCTNSCTLFPHLSFLFVQQRSVCCLINECDDDDDDDDDIVKENSDMLSSIPITPTVTEEVDSQLQKLCAAFLMQ